jgi:hypothetical protein
MWLYKMKPYYRPSLYKSEIAFSLLQCASFGAMSVAAFIGDAPHLFVVLMLCQTAAMCCFIGLQAKHVWKFGRNFSIAWRNRHERTPPQGAMAHSIMVSMKSLRYVRVLHGRTKRWTSHFQLRNLLFTGRIYELAAAKKGASRASDKYEPDRDVPTRDTTSAIRTSMSAWASRNSLVETTAQGLSFAQSVPTRLRTIDFKAAPAERHSALTTHWRAPQDSLHPSISAESEADVHRSLLIAAQPREASKAARLPALPKFTPSYISQKRPSEEEREDLPVEAAHFLQASADVLASEKLAAIDELRLENYTLVPALTLAAPSHPLQQSLDEDPALSSFEEEEEDLLHEAGNGEEEDGEEGAGADALAPDMSTADDELIPEDYTLLKDGEARDEWDVTRLLLFIFPIAEIHISSILLSLYLLMTKAHVS